jgi:protein TonB
MIESRNLLLDYGLIIGMLAGSTLGHIALANVHMRQVIHVAAYDREYGRTSVAIQLVAAKPKVEEQLDDLIPELKKPTETPQKLAQLKPRDLPLDRVKPPVDQIVSAVQPVREAPVVPRMTTPTLEPSEAKRDEIPPPTETPRKPLPKKKPVVEIPEPEMIEIESPVTALTKQSSGIDEPPKFMTNIDPVYPPDLHNRRIQGSLQVAIIVGTDGSPKAVRIHVSSGFAAFDEAGLEAARRSRYSPALRDGVPVEHEIIKPYLFSIGKSQLGSR